MTADASSDRVTLGRLAVATELHDFVRDELLAGTGVDPDGFWSALESIVADLGPRNAELLERRDDLQALIDRWHRDRAGQHHDAESYEAFLAEIGYLVDEPTGVEATTDGVDPEIATVAGPQLVVPLDNARYALNAANARWGSLYDALYGTDAIDEADGKAVGDVYNPVRGDAVVATVRRFLDDTFPLTRGSHAWATRYAVTGGELAVDLGDGTTAGLLRPGGLVGFTGADERPDTVLLRHHGLHVEIVFDPEHPVGRSDHAGVADVRIESAVTTIMDCEDSVAAVDLDDKLGVYRNWLGLMRGDLESVVEKGGRSFTRALEPDTEATGVDGAPMSVRRRSLMLVRNVGPHLTTDLVTHDGAPVPETMLDALVTSAAALHDLRGTGRFTNSPAGSVYIVKPKMHGPDEVGLADELFARVEGALGLEPRTLKMGIMDEERRTSLNLAACIAAARHRVVFINTGFLDRTGDEIHTDMEAGVVVPKGEMKQAAWLDAYERSNVDVGIGCGLLGRAQIGKGMWAMPDEMAAMLDQKIGHLLAGASCAWVPSPTAATLHALHYHRVDVGRRQAELAEREPADRREMLTLPVIDPERSLTDAEIQHELDNNAQGILGYVARWVGQGVGCSKVPDITGTGLMEDCATLRISSQHVANWLHHGVVDEARVRATMADMAAVVDRQNEVDPEYRPMATDLDSSVPYQAALALVLEGRAQPNGYTEHILQSRRRDQKSAG